MISADPISAVLLLGKMPRFELPLKARSEEHTSELQSREYISYRAEFVNDAQGQRTGTKTRYVETGIGWQLWFSPQIEMRPEVSYYRSLDANAFNGNSNLGILPNKSTALIGSADIIVHF